MTKILITGAAGFIGSHLFKKLNFDPSFSIVGLDNINSYYDTNLKCDRLKSIGFTSEQIEYNQFYPAFSNKNYKFIKLDITDRDNLLKLFKREEFDIVIHLAAQAGVRYSLENPRSYIESNLDGFFNVIDFCKCTGVKHLLYASSSSVYGSRKTGPFSESDFVDNPISLYAATKKANELMAHTYSHLFQLPTTGLRFFTVYGPWGRPDMAVFLFTKSILDGSPIKIFNKGEMFRDFTYIDDIIDGIVKLMKSIPGVSSSISNNVGTQGNNISPYYRVLNLGNSKPVKLLDFVETLEKILGRTALKEYVPIQPGDVPVTDSDISMAKKFNYSPKTTLHEGLTNFVSWYKDYYEIR